MRGPIAIKMSFEEEDLPQLQSLTLRNCETLLDIHGLAKLPRLESLSLHSLPPAFDTSCLQAATQLRELTFHQCTFLEHLDFLSPFNRLEKLIIQGVSDLRSIESFANLESLRSLYITDGKDIPHLVPLEQLTWLEDIEIRSISNVSTFPSLAKLTRLKRLILPQATSLYTLNVQNESLEEFYVSGLYWTHSIHMETPSLQHCTFKDTRSLRKHGSRKNRPADTVITYGSEMPKLRYLRIEESPQSFQSHTPTEIQEHIQEAFTWVSPSA